MGQTTDSGTSRSAPGFFGFLAQILAILRPYWPAAAIAVPVLLVLQTVFRVILPLGYQRIFDVAIAERDVEYLSLVLAVLFGAWVVQALAAIAQESLTARIGARAMNDLRLEMFGHLQKLPMSYYSRVDSGDLLSRFSSDLLAIEGSLIRGVPMFFYGCFILVVSVGLLFFMEWRLALVTCCVLPVALVGPRLWAERARLASYERKQTEARAAGTIQETIGAQAVVKVFGLAESRIGLFRRQLEELRSQVARSHFIAAAVGRAANQSIFFVQIVVVGFGAYLAVWGLITVGTLVGFVTLLINVANSANFLSGIVPEVLQASGGMRRVRELLDEEPDIVDRSDARDLPRLAQALTFRDVSFAYDGGRTVLDGVSFEISAGQTVAVIGGSGSGKSTILSLVLRLHDPVRGTVEIDGVDLRAGTERSLRDQTGVVLQDTVLFNTSLMENIRLGRPDATDTDVVEAAIRADIHDLIENLPEGYDTLVGERGGRLSGGQRQRIAIARAILRDPALLVLDEATSALDAATEATVNATLGVLARGRTVLSTTHRLQTIKGADQILVVDQGRLVDHGRHDELVARDGIYADLWRKQSGFTVSADGRRAECEPERLRSIPLLAHLGEKQLETVSRRLVSESYPEDRVIFAVGDPGDKFYLIVHGAVEVTLPEGTLYGPRAPRMRDGDYFGELALLDNAPRSATVRTVAPTLFLTLGREHFQELLDDEPELRAMIIHEARLRRQSSDSTLETIAVRI